MPTDRLGEKMFDDKERSAKYYNKSARDLQPLPMQQKGYTQGNPKQNLWTPVIFTETSIATQLRSHTVETKDGDHYQRNKEFLWPADKTPPPGETTDIVIPVWTSQSSPDKRSRDLRDFLRLCNIT